LGVAFMVALSAEQETISIGGWQMNRRELLRDVGVAAAAASPLLAAGASQAQSARAAGLALLPFAPRRAGSSVLVNDIHSQLNPTRVDRIVAIESEATLQAALAAARVEGKPVCVAGGRHAMGGQQFAEDAVLLDVRPMRRIIGLNAEHGVVEAEAGIQWPELIERLIGMQRGQRAAWGIIQKRRGTGSVQVHEQSDDSRTEGTDGGG
jgi:FAD binding domain